MKSLFDVQVALHKIMNAIVDKRIPLQRAGARLFDLQQASVALRRPNRSPD